MLRKIKFSLINFTTHTLLSIMFELPPSADPELLKTLLEPLLEDFDYWFSRSKTLLESERMEFITESSQQELLGRVVEGLGAVSVMRSLMVVTENRAGVEMSVLMGWHKLVHECWGISMKHRQMRSPG
jgi:Protein of unknown function (DUF2605)